MLQHLQTSGQIYALNEYTRTDHPGFQQQIAYLPTRPKPKVGQNKGGGGGTLHKCLYFHLRPRSRSWPSKFSCLTPWPHRKSGLDPWLLSINQAHRSPGETLTVLKLPPIPSLTAWPASKFHLDHLISLWPRSQVGVQSPMQCPPPPLQNLWKSGIFGLKSGQS